MTEDREMMKFLKVRLEEDVPGEVPHLDEILRYASAQSFAHRAERRSRLRLWVASAAAACVAVVCSFVFLRPQTAAVPAPEATVVSAIGLVMAADGAEEESDDTAVADMLLALQDAPYENVIEELVAENSQAELWCGLW